MFVLSGLCWEAVSWRRKMSVSFWILFHTINSLDEK